MTKVVLFWKNWFKIELPSYVRYSVAILLVAIGYIIEKRLLHIDTALDATILETITVAIALVLGLGPGMVAAVLVGLAIDYLDREPIGSILTSSSDYFFLIFYIAPSLIAGLLASSLRLAFKGVTESELRANAAVDEREEMMSIVSHDLRNPITSILLNTQLLKKVVTSVSGEDKVLSKAVGSIQWAAKSMNELIQNLLDSSKLKSGNFAVEKKETDLTALMQNIVTAFEPLAATKEITLEVALDKHAKAMIDADRITQVISNLIGNALKFTPKGGTVTLALIRKNDKFLIRVSDTGPGIETRDLTRIFERHWQGRKKAAAGAGLGLYISQGLVRAHGSEIKVKSDIGEGTEFYFTL